MTGPALGGGLADCARRLRAGELAVHPAETVYGFGGTLERRPLEALRALKGRQSGGFVVLIPALESAEPLLGDAGRLLARAFWPGPLTLVADDPAGCFPAGAKAPDGSVALRVPGREDTLALLREVGAPLTSTSANAPGGRPAVTAAEALATARGLGHELAVLDGGRLPGGRSSTLVRAGPGPPLLLRRGQVAERDLARALGGEIVVSEDAPGPAPFVITFVCTGNTCRSPMAEAIARRAVERGGVSGIEVRSAGVAAGLGAPASEGARRAAAEAGLDLARHRSTPLSREMVQSSSLILCMGRSHADQVEALGGGDRCRLLREMAADTSRAGGRPSTGETGLAGRTAEVADPFGGGDDLYRETFLELEEAVEAVLGGLARDRG